MRVTVVTLFPQVVRPFLRQSLVGKAKKAGLVDLRLVDLRKFTDDRRGTVDGPQVGGGPGMVIFAEPVAKAIEKHAKKGARVVMLSPQGKVLTQAKAQSLANDGRDLVLLCGHYEGFDERVMDMVDEEISIGDYVTMGGEVAAAVLIEAVIRLLPGVINEDSLQHESHAGPLLDHPVYAKPNVWRGKAVPEVLLSGHHAKIEAFRQAGKVHATKTKRPDLYERYVQSIGNERKETRHPGTHKARRAVPNEDERS